MKAVAEMTDDEVLREAGGMGPALIGQELYDRAQTIEKVNPTGALGPAFFDPPAADAPAAEPESRSAKKGKK